MKREPNPNQNFISHTSIQFFLWVIFRKVLSDAMIDFFNTVKRRCDEPNSFRSRDEKADAVKEKASILLDVFTQAQADESVNYYLHAAYHHLPDAIRACPIEIDDASGCCIEHAHQTVKRAML